MFRRRFQSNKKPFNANNYLTIEALEDNLQVSLTKIIQYCIDGGEWVILPPNELTQPVNKGQAISFKWNHNTDSVDVSGVGKFSINKKCNLMGNCLSIIFGDNASKNKDLSGYHFAFNDLFSNCNNIISVSENFLPATTLAEYCYYGMFYGCTSLVNAPKLPATTLAEYCYNDMFYGCTSLVNAPKLPATTLAAACYAEMFYGCSKLNYIKMLATDISARDCLIQWVEKVASSGTFVKNKNATWDVTGASGVPEGWTVITE